MQSSSIKITRLLLCGFFLFVNAFAQQANAQGNLLITPKRIVFDGSKKSEEVNLANIGKDSAAYIISLIQIRMKEDGSFEQITAPDPGQLFADKHIRFFPRTVTLAPNEAQTVKVQVIKANEMETGEYRSHLYFRANPAPRPLGEEVVDSKDSTLSVKLVPIFGISIPVVIRKGDTKAGAAITDVRVEYRADSSSLVHVVFNRTGNMSLYGNVMVDHIAPQGTTTRVAMVKGMSIYTPNTSRRFQMALDKTNGVDYHAGKLKVTYADQSAKPVNLAEAEIDLR